MDFSEQMEADLSMIESALRRRFQNQEARAGLYEAMTYSLLAGGKRIRPILTMETCRMCGGSPEQALPFACAVEMIHTYSLIHDDLPCMDNDDLRRGRPTSHKVFGEAMAVLAGDALLTAAFETALSAQDVDPGRTAAAAACLAAAAGDRGMVGGQAMDIAAEGRGISQKELEQLQALKTGALISAAAEMGCIVAGGNRQQRDAVSLYAQKLGRAFQIRDDMLDVEGDEKTLGKTVGSDSANDKTTFATLLGLDTCHKLVSKLTGEAVSALAPFEHPEFLCRLAELLVDRKR